MSIYGNNVVALDPTRVSHEVTQHLSRSEYVKRELQRVVDETGSYELDDPTSRSIVKFQSRMLLHRLFEQANVALDLLNREAMSAMATKDLVQVIVGLTGRIMGLVDSITNLEKLDAETESEWIRKLHGSNRDEAVAEIRKKFMEIFETLFTDADRTQLYQDLEKQVKESGYGGDPRVATDGQDGGSTRWRQVGGSSTVLPPVEGTTRIP